MKTSTPKPEAPTWFIVDASGKSLGRLSTEIARVLNGKHKPTWSAHQVHSDHVVVINAKDVELTGKKMEQKVYHRHSGYLGHLKTIPVARVLKEHPERVIERAVRGMLPRNRLREQMLKHLHVFAGPEHKHEAQKPAPLSDVSPSLAL